MASGVDRKVLLGIVLLVVLLALAALVTYRALHHLGSAGAALARGEETLQAVAGLAAALADAESEQNAFIGSGEARYLEGRTGVGLSQAFERMREQSEATGQKERIITLRDRINAERNALGRRVSLRKGNVLEPSRHADATEKWLEARHRTRTFLREIEDDEQAELEYQQQLSRHAWFVALAGAAFSTVLGLAATAGLVWLLRGQRAAGIRAATLVHDQRELLEGVLGKMSEAVLATDREGAVLLLNGPAAALTGWTTEEAVGKHINDVFRSMDATTRQPLDNAALQALRWGRAVHTEVSLLIARDGREQHIEQTAAPLRHEGGKVSGAILVFAPAS